MKDIFTNNRQFVTLIAPLSDKRNPKRKDHRRVLVYEYKLHGSKAQYAAIDEAIRVVQFIRNKCVRLWMDEHATKNNLQKYCAVLAHDYPFANHLNSQARQASADRAWSAIQRFYDNCKAKKPGKKGYPRYVKDNRSVEYKHSGWKLDPDGRHLTFTDGCGIGRLRLIGTRDVETFPIQHIKRVRLIRRADGYYCQFCVKADRVIEHVPTSAIVGIDVGLKAYYTDSNGHTVDNPRHYRKAEARLKQVQRRLSRKKKGSKNRLKQRQRVGKAHLKVQRQREDFARKEANALVTSHDLIAFEDVKICNLVRNRHLSKSISDAAWGQFLAWVNYYGALHAIPVIEVPPKFTSQDCSGCGTRVKKSLSVRTHICPNCGLVMDRDENAANTILKKAHNGTVGQTGTSTSARV